MAQFVAFGYPSLAKGNFYETLFFIVMCAIAEIVAYKVLKTEK